MRRWWFTVHKWLALIVAAQVLAWFVSGLFMTAFPIQRVRSEHNIRKAPVVDLRAAPPVPAEQALALAGAPVSRLELATIAGRRVWRIDSAGEPLALLDAETGARLSPIDETLAREIAAMDFSGNGKIVSARLIEKDPPIEHRGDLPVWQIVFDDSGATHLYVSPATGKVVGRRSGLWRAYDFLWSLHTMDWIGRDNFNNPQIVLFTVLSLVMAASGIGILFIRFWPRRRAQRLAPATSDDAFASFKEWSGEKDEKSLHDL